MDRHLVLAQESIEWIHDESAANRLCGVLEGPHELLDMVTATNPQELDHGLVILERHGSLVACESVRPAAQFGQ